MAEYIKRDDIFNVISIGRLEYPECDSVFDGMETEVRRIPSADVAEVRHGKWLWDGYVYDEPYVCNCCGNHMDYESNFCPHCGARMEEWMDGGT